MYLRVSFFVISVSASLEFSTKKWCFEGTKEELLTSFHCLKAYDRQFYPQFKEVNGYLAFRTLMHGFQEETIPFQVFVTFFHENDKPLPSIGDIVYPITEGKDTNFETYFSLKKLTKYYDTETQEFKNQDKMIFTMEIVSPKLDEIAKDERERIEFGIEDSDEEKGKDEKDSANGNDEKNDGEK